MAIKGLKEMADARVGYRQSPLDRGLRRSGLNVPRSIQGHAQDAQKKMAQGVSARPLLAEMRPVKHPAKNFQALRLALCGGVAFDCVVAPVMAVQVQRTVLAKAEVVHPEHAVVQQGIGFTLDHSGHAQVDGQAGIQRNQGQHVAGRHCQADRIGSMHTQPPQGFCRQAQVFAGHRRQLALLQLVVRHLHCPAMFHRQRRGRVDGRRPGRAAAQDRVGMFGPFSGA